MVVNLILILVSYIGLNLIENEDLIKCKLHAELSINLTYRETRPTKEMWDVLTFTTQDSRIIENVII